ncbi:MAG: HAMP domain-containing histidine kinase [Ruminococcaceae bacterium]|nr:HAMP domain-containing histidine kinase [Oscillospiraceae bacterium]
MFRSIFTKYITAFIAITIVSFTVLSVIVGMMMAKFYTETNKKTLETVSKTAHDYLEQRLNAEGSTLNEFIDEHEGELKAYIASVTKYHSDVAVFVCDSAGNVRAFDTTRFPADFGTKAVPKSLLVRLVDKPFYSHSDLGGMLSSRRAVHGIPLKVGELTVGAIFVCSTDESIDELISSALRAIITVCIWVLFATLVAVYFISERIISPLKQMSKAAKSFAAGKLDVRVPVTGRDEISELAIAFNDMAASMANLETMRSSFLSNVSHDLRTPMTTISGFIDGIIDGTIPKEKHEYYLRMISDEVRRLSRLVSALLDVTRIQAGERKFTMEAFDICEMARIILISFEQQIEKKKLDVEFDIEDENVFVYADRDAIYQILYNICDNAVKFSTEGGKYRIKITEKDKRIFVSVYNDGIGIPSDELPNVFERFYKNDKSRSLDKTGVGLGMYIAKSIIDAHNEEIWVRSKYGEYCEFVFTIKKATDAQIKKSYDK